jgi:hypothetical protein
VGIEHSCHACGHALGRIPALPDPLYGLKIVVCPECRIACVRRPDPVANGWRFAHRLRRSLCAGFSRLAVAGIFIGGTLGISSQVADSLRGLDLTRLSNPFGGAPTLAAFIDRWIEGDGQIIVVMWLVWSIALGIAASAILPHLRRFTVWLLFIGSFVTILGGTALIRFVLNVAASPTDSPMHVSAYDAWEPLHATAVYTGSSLVLALLGIPFGNGLRRAIAKWDARRWRVALARARKRRLAA